MEDEELKKEDPELADKIHEEMILGIFEGEVKNGFK